MDGLDSIASWSSSHLEATRRGTLLNIRKTLDHIKPMTNVNDFIEKAMRMEIDVVDTLIEMGDPEVVQKVIGIMCLVIHLQTIVHAIEDEQNSRSELRQQRQRLVDLN